LTVKVVPITQPLADVKVILVVPALTPVTVPVPTPMVATVGALLVHDPPVSVLVSVVEPPLAQVLSVPPIGEGVG
jgi:hypothetical protein